MDECEQRTEYGKDMRDWFKCPSCNGKGHVFDSMFLWVPVVGWLHGWFERNDADGISRDKCGQCNGKGFVSV